MHIFGTSSRDYLWANSILYQCCCRSIACRWVQEGSSTSSVRMYHMTGNVTVAQDGSKADYTYKGMVTLTGYQGKVCAKGPSAGTVTSYCQNAYPDKELCGSIYYELE